LGRTNGYKQWFSVAVNKKEWHQLKLQLDQYLPVTSSISNICISKQAGCKYPAQNHRYAVSIVSTVLYLYDRQARWYRLMKRELLIGVNKLPFADRQLESTSLDSWGHWVSFDASTALPYLDFIPDLDM